MAQSEAPGTHDQEGTQNSQDVKGPKYGRRDTHSKGGSPCSPDLSPRNGQRRALTSPALNSLLERAWRYALVSAPPMTCDVTLGNFPPRDNDREEPEESAIRLGLGPRRWLKEKARNLKEREGSGEGGAGVQANAVRSSSSPLGVWEVPDERNRSGIPDVGTARGGERGVTARPPKP